MNFKEKDKHMVDILFVLALFCVFALSALMLVLLGSSVYKKTVSNMDANYNTRTSFAYITEKLRQNDSIDSISIGKLDSIDAFIFTETINDVEYSTYLYEYNGYLKELFAKADQTLDPSAGQNIIEIADLSFTTINDHLYQFHLTNENKESITLYVSTHSTKQ